MLPGDLFLAMVVINRIGTGSMRCGVPGPTGGYRVRCRWLGTGTARPGVTLRVVLGQPAYSVSRAVLLRDHVIVRDAVGKGGGRIAATPRLSPGYPRGFRHLTSRALKVLPLRT
jgi:hypothetical protein